MERNKVYNIDCLVGMKDIPDGSVDCIICDLPYGTISSVCEWDVPIPFDRLWEEYHRIIKPDGAVLLFGQEPFSSMVRMSNVEEYKYDWYWVKEQATNVFQMNKRPGKVVETISVFYRNQPTYNEQRREYRGKKVTNKIKSGAGLVVGGHGKTKLQEYKDDGTRHALQVLYFNRLPKGKAVHPTQKPVELVEYLVRIYTNEGDLVLDNCIGSGTTAVACINTGRDYIGYELNEEYYKICMDRINNTDRFEPLF